VNNQNMIACAENASRFNLGTHDHILVIHSFQLIILNENIV